MIVLVPAPPAISLTFDVPDTTILVTGDDPYTVPEVLLKSNEPVPKSMVLALLLDELKLDAVNV